MFKIGEFSRLTQVTVKALRHYDRLGLLEPARTDPETGYRYYAVEQLPRLNRILALKDIGFSLDQVRQLLDANLSSGQIQQMLLARQEEARSAVATEQERLRRVEARLGEVEEAVRYDVVLKRIEAQRVASVRAVLPSHQAVGQLFGELEDYRRRFGLTASAWTVTWHDAEYRETNVDAEATFTTIGPILADGRVEERELPTCLVASAVHHGSPTAVGQAYVAALRWMAANGYGPAGPQRAVRLGWGRESSTIEVQFPVERREV